MTNFIRRAGVAGVAAAQLEGHEGFQREFERLFVFCCRLGIALDHLNMLLLVLHDDFLVTGSLLSRARLCVSGVDWDIATRNSQVAA